MTFRQMHSRNDPDLVPTDQTILEGLLWTYGAWEMLERIQTAPDNRTYKKDLDGKVDFRVV